MTVMKKNLVFHIVALAALLATACTREIFPGDEDRGFGDGQTGLVMSVRSMAPQTRAIAPPNLYNEYKLVQFYYFIYAENPATVTTAVPVFVGKWTGPEAPTAEPPATPVVGAEKNIVLDNLTDLKTGDTYSGYVFVIANYNVSATLAAWDAIIAAQGGSTAPDYSALTWSNIQALELPKPTFNVYNNIKDTDIWADECYDPKYDNGDRFKPQDSFVMTSSDADGNMAPVSFSVESGQQKTIEAPLKRVAAKLNLNINLARWYVQTNNGEYKYTWYSHPERLQVYLNYAADAGRLDGTPMTYTTNTSANFFPYSRYAFLTKFVTDAQGNPVLDGQGNPTYPDGSYNEDVPYVWKYKESPAATQPETDGYYYTSEQDLVDNMVIINGEVKYRTITRPAYRLAGTPFYSYPYDFSGDSGHAPFFKVIVEWTAYRETTHATDETAGDKAAMVIGQEPFYYKILIPNQTLFSANKWYNINLNVSTLGSEADETAIDLVGEQGYYVVDWSNPDEVEKMDLSAGLYFNVASDSFDMYGNSLQIPFTASGPVVISAYGSEEDDPTASYPYAASDGKGSLDYSTDSSEGTNFMVTPNNDESYVQIDHTILPFSTSFSYANGNAKDVALITYKFRISLEGHPEYFKDITVTQYPSIYAARQQSRGNPFVYRTSTGAARNENTYSLGSVSPNGWGSKYNTIVSISTLSGLSSTYPKWVIGDPRIKLSDAYNGTYQGVPSFHNNYGSNSDATEWRRTDLKDRDDPNANDHYFDNYLVGDINSSQFIAPKFMLASGYGYNSDATSANSNWKLNSERCASYQEDGYPAGRWRLPTEAELLFCATLASNGLIENPFRADTNYWSTSGRCLNYQDNQGNWSFTPSPSSTSAKSVRCIYDLWYWGDNPVVTPGTYKVMLPE